MSLIGDAAAPYMAWIKLAAIAVVLGGAAYAGNAARGHWDAGDIAKANAATQAAEVARDAWKAAAGTYSQAIAQQKAASAQAQAEAAHDAVLADRAIESAAKAEQNYLRRRREIDAAARQDASAPCASAKIQGSPLQ